MNNITKRFATLLFILLLFTTTQAQVASRGQATEMIIAGDNSLQMLDIEKAIEFYTSAISLDPGFADAYLKRSNAFAIAGRNTEARIDYDKALAINPYINYVYDKRAKIQVLIADFMGKLIDLDKAATMEPETGDMMQQFILQDLRAAYPENILTIDSLIDAGQVTPKLMTIKALALWSVDEVNTAQQVLEDLLAKNANDAFAQNVYGLLLIETGTYTKALTAFNKAIGLDSKYAYAYLNRGRVHDLLADKTKALKDLNTAILLDTTNALAFYARGMFYKGLGNADAAIQDYTSVIKLRPNFADAYFSRGFAEKMKGVFTDALIDYDRAIELNPNDAVYFNNRGIVKVIAGKNFDAEKDFKRAISLQPDYAAAYHNLGMTQIKNHSRNEGCDNIETSINKGLITDKDIYRYFCVQ
jgi:tetratricopeptide (TPR) repeat protein